jgi:sarcosine oxidase subunit gamma
MPVSAAERAHPLAGRYVPGGDGPLRLDAPARDVVQVLARRGRGADVARALGALPGPGGTSVSGPHTALWLQPDVWAVMADAGAEGALAAALRKAVGEAASVTDQSHGRVVIGVEGALASRVLAKGVRIDLDPRAFPVGASAVTECAHLGIALLRPGAQRFEVITMRTFAAHLWHWLTEAAGEYGFTVA